MRYSAGSSVSSRRSETLMTGALRHKILLAVAVTIGTLLVAEVALRALAPPQATAGLRGLFVARPDRPWLYGLRPGADAELPTPEVVRYSINAAGFRDRPYPLAKASGVFRIAVLGDSIAMGYGVEREAAFPDLIDQTLSTLAPDARVEVLNFGVGAYNAYNERMLFEDIVLDYEPDLVLLQFCINDLNDPTLHFDAATRLFLAEIPDAAYPDPDARAPVPTRSYLAALCRRVHVCRLATGALAEVASENPDATSWRAAMEPRDSPQHVTEWRWLEDNYQRIAESADRHGASFAVLAFPYATQMEGSAGDGAQQRLAGMGRSNDWPTVDLLPAYREATDRDSERLFEDIWHPNPAGHRVAAQVIVEELACLGLLPDAAADLCSRTGR